MRTGLHRLRMTLKKSTLKMTSRLCIAHWNCSIEAVVGAIQRPTACHCSVTVTVGATPGTAACREKNCIRIAHRNSSASSLFLSCQASSQSAAVQQYPGVNAHHLAAAALVISTMMSLTSFLFSAGRMKGTRQVNGFPPALHSTVRPSLHAYDHLSEGRDNCSVA